MTGKQFFLGRQPILGRDGRLSAYELLFRAANVGHAEVHDDLAASAAVIQHLFGDLGVQAVLGDRLGFINVSEGLLLSELIEALPRAHVVIEILETVQLTDAVVARLKVLKALGYQLALDDVVGWEDRYDEVLPLIDIVKIDIMGMEEAPLRGLVSRLRHYDLRLLAEKVDSDAQRQQCMDLGFDLFQGYHFARPTILSGRPVSHSSLQLLKILGLVSSDADTAALEEALKLAPDLTVQLLKLVNSVGFGAKAPIASVRTAISLLGRSQLHRWVQIMVFARSSPTASAADPLVQMAALRGKQMELLAQGLGHKNLADQAFMVGMFSLMGALFGQPLADILEPLNLADDVTAALLHGEGFCGDLLALCIACEQIDAQSVAAIMERAPDLGVDLLNQAQVEALAWVTAFAQ